MLLAQKIELQPNEAQHLNKIWGIIRHCYNQLLEYFSEKENPFSLKAAYNRYKNTIREQFEWYQEISFHISTIEFSMIGLKNCRGSSFCHQW